MERILDQEKSQIPVEYAGFWIRFAAYLIDSIVLGMAGLLISVLFYGSLFAAADPDTNEINWVIPVITNVIGVVGSWLYFALMESSEKQATLGKMAVGVRVVDRNNERISFGKATGRYFGKILSGLILMIGYIMAGFDERKQALHDKLANTFVIYGRA